MREQSFGNEYKPVFGPLRAGLMLTAIWVGAMAPVCLAQDFPVSAVPKTAPPTAPGLSLPAATEGAEAAATAAPAAPMVPYLRAAPTPGTLNSFTRSASTEKTLHVLLGHSLFVDTKTRLRRVYVSDPAVVNSITLSPNQIIVTGMSPGICSLTLLDENGLAQSYVVSSDLDIEGLRSAMAAEMHGNSIKVEGSGGRVVLSGAVASDAMAEAAVKLAGAYSKDVVNALAVESIHPKQVRLEVRILEVDRSKALQLGINLFSPGGNSNYIASSTSSQFPTASTLATSAAGSNSFGTLTTSNPLNFLLYSAKLNLGTTIQDLQTKQVLQILAEPTITTMSGVKANFLSGGEFPFPVVSSGTGGAPVVSISFRKFGVQLEFTPIVNSDGTIRLKVAPEVSSLDYSNSITISGFSIPALSTRNADTEVELRSGQSFAISGLLDQRTTDIMSKNPGAANIPILGALFKSKTANHSVTELVVVVTPTVVDPLAETSAPNEPELPIAPLDVHQYDKSLGRDVNPNPQAPPITPDHPPIAPPVFPSSTPPPAPPGPAAKAAVASVQQTPAAAKPAAVKGTIPSPAPSTPATAVKTSAVSAKAAAGTAVASAAIAAPAAATVPAVAAKTALPTPASARPAVAKAVPPVAPSPAATGSVSGGGTAASGQQAVPVAPAPKPWVVEVMALSHESDADIMVAALQKHGYKVAVTHSPQDSLLHLDVGPFTSKQDAENMRQQLVLDGYNATMK